MAGSDHEAIETEDHASEDRIAFHEAGHAVACFALGLTIEDARIFRHGDSYRGLVRARYYAQYAHQKLRFFLAGFSAERLVGEPVPEWPSHAGRDQREYDDVINAWREAGHSNADIDAAERAAALAVDHLITTKVAAIEAVAAALKEHPAKNSSTDYERRLQLVHDALRTNWGGAEPPTIGAPWEGSPVPGPLAT